MVVDVKPIQFSAHVDRNLWGASLCRVTVCNPFEFNVLLSYSIRYCSSSTYRLCEIVHVFRQHAHALFDVYLMADYNASDQQSSQVLSRNGDDRRSSGRDRHAL